MNILEIIALIVYAGIGLILLSLACYGWFETDNVPFA